MTAAAGNVTKLSVGGASATGGRTSRTPSMTVVNEAEDGELLPKSKANIVLHELKIV